MYCICNTRDVYDVITVNVSSATQKQKTESAVVVRVRAGRLWHTYQKVGVTHIWNVIIYSCMSDCTVVSMFIVWHM